MASQSVQIDGRPINSFLFEFNYMQKPWAQNVSASTPVDAHNGSGRIAKSKIGENAVVTVAKNDDRASSTRRRP